MDDEFYARQAATIRELADGADPFIRKRLLALAARYETPKRRPLSEPVVPVPQSLTSTPER